MLRRRLLFYLEHPNFFDVRADLVFDFVSYLSIEQGFSQRRVNADLAFLGPVLHVDEGEG
jgi:hypothetical protein